MNKALLLVLSFLVPTLAGAEPVGTRPTAVVELFTSQGCSSCPPADEILSGYADDGDVLALAWHVDYWNYLGWKDTFSSAAFTDRQQRYAQTLGQRSIYTPQAVVNGRNHAVGSKKPAIDALVAAGLPAPAVSPGDLPLTIEVDRKGDALSVSVETDVETSRADCVVELVHYRAAQEEQITRGENSGKAIRYRNIVRDVERVGRMVDGKFEGELSMAKLTAKARAVGSDRVALLVQEAGTDGTRISRIVGALELGPSL